MRIGVVAPPWVAVPPARYGGTEAVIDELARGFERAGHDVMLWTTGDSTCQVPRGHVLAEAQGERMGVAAVELDHVIAGYEALTAWGADIVHDHTLTGPLCAEGYHPPVVTTSHGPFEGELAALYRRIAPRVPVIAISHDQAHRARTIPIAAVVHHGLDTDAYPAGDGGGDDGGPYFLFLGRIIPDKGADHAARAVRQMGGRLLIAGKMQEAHEHRFFAEQLEPLLGDDVVYLGEVPHDEKLRLLAGATALVNPLRWPEPFGMVMIEALACGTPVVAYRYATAPEIIDDGVTGYLCDGLDDLAAKLAEAPRLDRTACRAAVADRFSTDRMVADHITLFERVLRSHQVASAAGHPTHPDGERAALRPATG
ncbi:MAG TPA: glycosyltransferase family 4 protein [Acidimicrobiales bacterium]|nr:glycosyltransferase family 4 protein [Acidimicrobiales bacterium]